MDVIVDEVKAEAADQLYLDLMKQCLTRFIFPDTYRQIKTRPSKRDHPVAWAVYPFLSRVLKKLNLKLYRHSPFDQAERAEGRDWPAQADTMIGLKRLDNLQY